MTKKQLKAIEISQKLKEKNVPLSFYQGRDVNEDTSADSFVTKVENDHNAFLKGIGVATGDNNQNSSSQTGKATQEEIDKAMEALNIPGA